MRNVTNFSSWQLPSLDGGDVPGFRQPVDDAEVIETEVELTVEEQAEKNASELQAIKDAAYQEGFESGREQGLAAAQQQINEQTTLLLSMMNELAEPLQRCGEKTQQQLLKLAFAIARQIVRRELKQDPTQLIAIIREALKMLPSGAQKMTISLNPEDASIVKNTLSIDSDSDSESEASRWQINSDPAIARGDCEVSTDNSKIDASIDKQIAVLFSRVAGGQRAGEVPLTETDSSLEMDTNQNEQLKVTRSKEVNTGDSNVDDTE